MPLSAQRAGDLKQRVFAIRNARVVTEPGKILPEATVVIRDGEALLHLPAGQEPPTVPLKVADYLGDWSVVEDAPHTARVTAPSPVVYGPVLANAMPKSM